MAENIEVVTIDARDLTEQLVLQVETRVINLRWVKIRLWIALRICKFAAWFGGIGLEINQEVGVLITESDIEEYEG